MLSIAALVVMLWATATILLIQYTVDADQSTKSKKSKKAKKNDDGSRGPSGLGGEMSRLERKFDGAELELRKAIYLQSHKHHNHVRKSDRGYYIARGDQ